jgi:tetratricopeptide (TPR) repeat protein
MKTIHSHPAGPIYRAPTPHPIRAFFLKPFSGARPADYLVPAIAGGIMLVASALPWLRSPFGTLYSDWKLPVNFGGQLQIGICSYGALCLCCAFSCFLLAHANWKASKAGELVYGRRLIGLLCGLPVACFLVQYLSLDLGAINLLAQQKSQMVLIQSHFGYRVGPELFTYHPFTVDITSLWGRFQLLVDQMQVGALAPMAAFWIMLDHRRAIGRDKPDSSTIHRAVTRRRPSPWMMVVVGVMSLALLFMLVRTVGWMACQGLAENDLAQGDYVSALRWLDRAFFFNPALDQTVFYHVERGQILYLAYQDRQSDDSLAYTVSLLIAQNDPQDAYEQLLPIWQRHRTTGWVIDDMSNTLELLAESNRPTPVRYIPEVPDKLVRQDSAALPWLQQLTRLDPGNVYGQYMIGRIDYDLQDYSLCNTQLVAALRLSSDANFQSSVYAYMALSDAGMGDYADERLLLLQAVQLDPTYRNLTARQELSGLR